MPSSDKFPVRIPWWSRLTLAALALSFLTAGPMRAQANGSLPVITSAGAYWDLPEAEKKRPHPIDMEIVVYHYDAAWKLLYGRTGDIASYFPVKGAPLPIRSGQKVRLQGTVVPAEGVDADTITATILAYDQLPPPLAGAGKLGDVGTLNGRWVEIEGYVLGQNEPDGTHVEARVWSDGHLVNLTLQISGTEPVPQLTGAKIRVRGVYDAAVDAAGRIQRIEFWTAEQSRLEVVGWLADDERFKLPPTAIEHLSAAGKSWVRIIGRVQAQERGATLTVRDETGQVEIATAQPGELPPGAAVEVVGHAAPGEGGWTLQDSLFRQLDDAAAPRVVAGGLPVRLRLADQVLQLGAANAGKGFPVTLRGVVSWVDEQAGEFYVQDISGGVAVRNRPGASLAFGSAVVVSGVTEVTDGGQRRAVVAAETVDEDGVGNLPPPRRISLEQAVSGAEEGRWVEMGGYVRLVATSGDRTRLELATATGEFSAILPADPLLIQLQSAMVRVRGVCVTEPGRSNEPGGIVLLVQNRAGVTVAVAGTTDPFATELQDVRGLRQLAVAQLPSARVRVAGVVTLHRPGRYLYLQQGDAGLLVLTREARTLAPGQAVEVAGLPGRAGNRAALREGQWRETTGQPPVAPAVLASIADVDLALDMRLVQVVTLLRQAAREGGGWRLTLEADGRIFESTLPAPADWLSPEPGSKLELTGVYVAEFDEYRRPHSFQLELRGVDDVRLLAEPPWWNGQRIAVAAGVLALVTLGVAGWVVALRRRVRQQTEQIREQLAKEAALQTEVERAARLESLGVLAGGIAHDFNNLLTAILGNLGLAAMDKRVMAAAGDCISEAERGARRARDITHQLLTFAKGGEPVRTAVLLPEIVTEAANFARHGSQVRLDVSCPPDLPAGDVDAGQVSRVVHNLVLNAVEAMPAGGMVSINLARVDVKAGEVGSLAPGRYIRLAVTDTGEGIPPEILPRIFDPYFSSKPKNRNSGLGLATVHSIIVKHHGHVEVESKVGAGTTVRLWLPAAREETPAPARRVHASALAPARVLVMDDEAVIRRVAGRMLALAGHETVFAAEGAEAVRAYIAARQSGTPFDFVILDLTVPGGMGGKEALGELLKIDAGIRAIASSGYSNDAVMANPHAFGFRSRLPKPYDIPDLIRAIEEARRP